MRRLLFVINHQLWDLSRLLGLRNRLKCPHCQAIGTRKPHGGWLDKGDIAGVRRWLCKWCGEYESADLAAPCHPNSVKKCWILDPGPTKSGRPGRVRGQQQTPERQCFPWNPWVG